MLREFPSDPDEQKVEAARPQPGDVLAGKYRIEKVIGEGGMGIVFAARHVALDQVVAVKVLLTDAVKGEDVVERFVREAQAAARLKSEHVARVIDAGTLDSGVPFLAMEFLEGCDLDELLKLNKQLPIPEAVDYVLQALAAMGQAHAAGIVHRDLKPSNLFLALRPDGSNIIKILDFGISKQTAMKREEKALTGRAVLGSPAYMPPEQLRSAKGVDARADLWALGIVLYELLAGATPFDGDGVGEIFAAILEKDPASLRAVRPDVPEPLETAILRCLKRSVGERWQNCGEMARALAPHGSGKWSHLVMEIEQTLARSSNMHLTSSTGRVLIAAANRALQSLRPPPRLEIDENNGNGPKSASVAFTRSESNIQIAGTGGSEKETVIAPQSGGRGRKWAAIAVAAVLVAGGAAAMARYARPPAAPGSAHAVAAALPPAAMDPPVLPIATANDKRAEDPEPAAVAVATPRSSASGAAKIAPTRSRPLALPQPGKPATRPKFLNSRD